MYERGSQSILGFALAASLVLHLCVLLLRLSLTSPVPEPSPAEAEPIEITEIPLPTEEAKPIAKKPIPPQSKEQQIAETEKSPNDEVDPDAKYLSEKNQKAEKETKAQITDDFREKNGKGLSKQDSLEPERGIPTAAETIQGDDNSLAIEGEGLKPKEMAGIKRDWKTLNIQDLSLGGKGGVAAATDDYLHDVNQGDRTVLSTREFKYFSYYNRIKELLRQHWKPSVERELAKMWGRGKGITENEWITKLIVTLNEKGKIEKIAKVSSSGIHELDGAAVYAFEKAAPFPNPPKGMVDEDGLIRLRWDFILTTENTAQIQFRTVGQPQRGGRY